MEKLIKIQSELKAPKGQYNSFGKYKYRSCEDILEALKPILLKHDCTLVITDEIKQIGDIIYCEATATISDKNTQISVKAQAGIDPTKKRMDISQTFGASSSYARKYALNGLFLIDDTKDADTNEHKQVLDTKPKIQKANEPAMWLNKDTEQWAKLVSSIDEGKTFTVSDIRKKYKVSKETEAELKKLGIN
ncbi:ERF family protein [Riemerella anatipestifer]|uniref:ERF family protein n=1 Tax=Riemerella anatipestifer TaxID=34085 RepID=UPI001C1DD6BE|nr:ERF family protein [Riemerella anatipestifer]QWU97386.1 ERF family protein [Riemerella anatipestifer]